MLRRPDCGQNNFVLVVAYPRRRKYDFRTFIEISKIKMSIPNYYERLYAFSHVITMLRFRMPISLLCDHDYYYDSPTQRNKFIDKIKYKQY